MSYTFVKVTTFYPEYLRDYDNRYPDMKLESYGEQRLHLMGDCHAWADFFEIHLRKLGVNAHEIIYNAKHLQRAWMEEQGLWSDGDCDRDIVLKQLKVMEPDVIFFQEMKAFLGGWINFLRGEVRSIRQVFGFWCIGYGSEDLEGFKDFDYILACSEDLVRDCRENGMKAYRLNHGFERSILERLKSDGCGLRGNEKSGNEKEHNVVFIGSLVLLKGYHHERVRILDALLKRGIGMDIYSSLYYESWLKLWIKFLISWGFERFRERGLKRVLEGIFGLKVMSDIECLSWISKGLIGRVQKPIFGLEMFKILASSKVVWNHHLEGTGCWAVNMRLFEATGIGSCLLTDWKKNLKDLFEIDEEVVAYRTVEECEEKAIWLLEHPREREEIARAGQRRTLKDHSLESRILKVHGIIEENWGRGLRV